jgi:HAD superfamily hydrolase (TIGR01509 family)
MIKAVIFDLDGVLVDADKWHYEALNKALRQFGYEVISWVEHLTIYKGSPTRKKLDLYSSRKGVSFSVDMLDRIVDAKQQYTEEVIKASCVPVPEKVEMMRLLIRDYEIIVCSNAIRSSVKLMLDMSGLTPYVEFFLSNQDVQSPKPDPEIYRKAFEMASLEPSECVIVEDSDVGQKAALLSQGILCRVQGPDEVNYYRVLATIIESSRTNIVIPAAGQGKRFAEAGYQHPKPLIDVAGRPMLELVLDNFDNLGRKIVLMQKEHISKYCADTVFSNCTILPVNGLTEGAACTVLLAKELIDNEAELIIANSDQRVDTPLAYFIDEMRSVNADAGILTFHSNNPKWSYAEIGKRGRVMYVAEKVVISDQATVGIYYFKHGKDFVKYAEQMISKNIRVNGEFYVAPVFNEFIQAGKDIRTYEIPPSVMHGLGTPEDLQIYLEGSANV